MLLKTARGARTTWWFMLVPGGLSWALVTYYHFLRRDVVNPFGAHEVDPIFMANKGMAITAAVLIGAAVAIGPMARWFAACRPWAASRREIGLAGFGWALIHVCTALLPLLERFPWSWYLERPLVIIAGATALLLLIVIAASSNRRALRWMGGRKWKLTQRLVHVVIALIVIHFVAMGKAANWVVWYRGEGTEQTSLPPGTLMLSVALLALLAVRASVWIPVRTRKPQELAAETPPADITPAEASSRKQS